MSFVTVDYPHVRAVFYQQSRILVYMQTFHADSQIYIDKRCVFVTDCMRFLSREGQGPCRGSIHRGEDQDISGVQNLREEGQGRSGEAGCL